MAKKKFEEAPFDPIEQQAKRDAAVKASQAASAFEVLEGKKNEKKTEVSPSKKVIPAPARRKPKVRNFSCSDATQDAELDSFLTRVREVSGTSVSLAIFLRAGLISQLRAEEYLIEEIKKNPPPEQPATHDQAAYAEFEEYWINIVGKSLSKLRPRQLG